MEQKIQVYAVIRVDDYAILEDSVTVKEVLPTMDQAAEEVERLNRLNKDKQAHYFWQTTRYFPRGRKVETRRKRQLQSESKPISSSTPD